MIKTTSLFTSIVTVFCLCTAHTLWGQKDISDNFDTDIPNYFSEYGYRDISAVFRSGTIERPVIVLSRKESNDDTLVTLQTPDPNSPGRVEVVLGGEGVKLTYNLPEEFEEAQKLFNEGNFLEALEILRPIAYPLFGYIDLSKEAFVNIHQVADLALTSMYLGKQWSELMNILGRFDFSKVDSRYLSMALGVSEKFIDRQDFKKGAQLFDKIPFEQTDLDQRVLAMRFTAKLREADQFRQAQFFYRRLAALSDFEYKDEALLWIAYCNIRLEKPELARIFLQEVGEFPRAKREFSLHRLIMTRLALLEGDFDKGIRLISEATAFSRLGYSWIPELLYTNALCYEALKKADVATNVYQQVVLFFEDNNWAQKSKEKIQQLAPEAKRIMEEKKRLKEQQNANS